MGSLTPCRAPSFTVQPFRLFLLNLFLPEAQNWLHEAFYTLGWDLGDVELCHRSAAFSVLSPQHGGGQASPSFGEKSLTNKGAAWTWQCGTSARNSSPLRPVKGGALSATVGITLETTAATVVVDRLDYCGEFVKIF